MQKKKKKLLKINYNLISIPEKNLKIEDQIEIMFWNLWKQFGIDKENLKPHMLISDYAWTLQTKNDFYEIPFHKNLLKVFEKRKLMASWTLDCEPANEN